jgi:SAM-dependent methyltransferase
LGLSKNLFNYISRNRDMVCGRSVLVLGNPFFETSILKGVVAKELIGEIESLPRHQRSEKLFLRYFKVSNYSILDIDSSEGANFVYDLNEFISDTNLIGVFDIIIDGGTQEHIFDNTRFTINIFNFLRPNGLYFFDLPANGYMEHGFRQYSPTYFYDLCFHNKNMLKIHGLILYESGSIGGLNCLPVYQEKETSTWSMRTETTLLQPYGTLNLDFFTGTCLALFNRINGSTSILGCIELRTSGQLDFRVKQFLYRNFSLAHVLPSDTNSSVILNKVLIRSFKRLLVLTPLPFLVKVAFLKLLFASYRFLRH